MKRLFGLLLLLAALALAGCGGGSSEAPAGVVDLAALPATVDVGTVASLDREEVLLLDVREPWEYEEGHIPGVTLIPMGEVADRLDEIPTDRPVVVTCRSGNRSGQIAALLRDRGYDNVHNMAGGILAWEQAGLPVER